MPSRGLKSVLKCHTMNTLQMENSRLFDCCSKRDFFFLAIQINKTYFGAMCACVNEWSYLWVNLILIQYCFIPLFVKPQPYNHNTVCVYDSSSDQISFYIKQNWNILAFSLFGLTVESSSVFVCIFFFHWIFVWHFFFLL